MSPGPGRDAVPAALVGTGTLPGSPLTGIPVPGPTPGTGAGAAGAGSIAPGPTPGIPGTGVTGTGIPAGPGAGTGIDRPPAPRVGDTPTPGAGKTPGPGDTGTGMAIAGPTAGSTGTGLAAPGPTVEDTGTGTSVVGPVAGAGNAPTVGSTGGDAPVTGQGHEVRTMAIAIDLGGAAVLLGLAVAPEADSLTPQYQSGSFSRKCLDNRNLQRWSL